MSDFDRNATTAQYGRPLTRAEADVVDAGLRAYMLRVYNYMVIGLVITGFAALGAYMLSVTDDPAAAAKVLRGGDRDSGADPCRHVSHADRLRAVREPAEMAGDPGAARRSSSS